MRKIQPFAAGLEDKGSHKPWYKSGLRKLRMTSFSSQQRNGDLYSTNARTEFCQPPDDLEEDSPPDLSDKNPDLLTLLFQP